jgi:hypothetical protein
MRSIAVRAPDTTMTSERLRRWTGPIILLLAGTGLATWKLPLFPDAMVDFGREVYVPWRITEGEAIYRDIEYFNGPLSPYLHALVFSLFGVSIMTLKVFNLGIVALVTALLYRLLLEISDRFAATLACLAYLSVFAFGHHQGIGIFNWITPYSYELPHGVALSLGMIASLWWYGRSRKRLYVALGGVLFGLVLLTKAEVQLAAGLAVVGWVICLPLQRQGRGESVRAVLMFAGCAVGPVVVAALLLWSMMPLGEVLLGFAGAWKWIGDSELNRLFYFRFIFGTTDTRQSLLSIARWAGIYAVLLAAAVLLALLLPRIRRLPSGRTLFVPIALLTAATLYLINRHQPTWYLIVRQAPLFMLIAGLVLLWRVVRHRGDPARLQQLALPMMLVILAGALLGKTLLHVRVAHYGFALTMPAAVLILVWLVSHLPRHVERLGGSGALIRAVFTGAWLVAMFIFIVAQSQLVAFKRELVATGGDAFYTDGQRARFVNATLYELSRLQTPNQTLVVIPEGLIINYFSRRINPTGHLNFTPPALIMFGEEQMLADMMRHPPDLIVLVHADTSDYNAQYFGRDYGREIARWINQNYRVASRLGALPFTSDRFGVLIMQRRDLEGPR